MKTVLLLIFFPFILFSQNTIGLPDVINYTKQSYNGGLQNWDIKQDKNGIIYVANNEGLLSFDGTHWRPPRRPGVAGGFRRSIGGAERQSFRPRASRDSRQESFPCYRQKS